MKHEQSRIDLINEFYAAHPETLFSQLTLCAVTGYSSAWAERKRWAGDGVPFIKIGRAVRYRKSDILNYIEKQKTNESTSQY